jgi:hypothetical protein
MDCHPSGLAFDSAMTEKDGKTCESASLIESTRASLLVKTGAFYAAMRQTAPVIEHPLRGES